MTFPAQFMLVAAMNPSPGSGGFGDAERGRASAAAIRKYLNKISARSSTASTSTSKCPP